MKYLIEKSGKLHSGIAVESVDFDSEKYDLIETEIEPKFIVNRWNGNNWEEIATEEEIASFNSQPVINESQELLEEFNQYLISIGKMPLNKPI
jgi:hypothetical protein